MENETQKNKEARKESLRDSPRESVGAREESLGDSPQSKMREITIRTNGNTATIIKAEVAGSLELKAILQGLVDNIK